MRLWILNQNPRTGADSKCEDPHISELEDEILPKKIPTVESPRCRVDRLTEGKKLIEGTFAIHEGEG